MSKDLYVRESKELVAISQELIGMHLSDSVSLPTTQSGMFDSLIESKSDCPVKIREGASLNSSGNSLDSTENKPTQSGAKSKRRENQTPTLQQIITRHRRSKNITQIHKPSHIISQISKSHKQDVEVILLPQ